MATIAQVHASLDARTASVLSGTPVLYKNQSDEELSKGSVPYVKQEVFITDSNQFELGHTNRTKKKGVILFIIHIPKGVGAAQSNALLQTVLDSFGSQVVGAAVCLNARVLSQGQFRGWDLTGVEIPFYFYNM